MAQAWMIASGKGGVGKTTMAAYLAIGLSLKGERVVIVDTDIGLRNMDAILGLENNIVYDICDVAEKSCKLQEALVEHPTYPQLSLLPAAQFRRVKAINSDQLAKVIKKLKKDFSYVIIDCPAGIERGFLNSINVADDIILVTTPDDMTIRDVEQTANILMKKRQPRPYLIVNRMEPQLIKSGDMHTANIIAESLDLPLIGAVPQDTVIYKGLLSHTPPMVEEGIGKEAVMRIVSRMQGSLTPVPPMGIVKIPFWKRIFKRK